MESNDIEPETDEISQFVDKVSGSVHEIYIEDQDEDVHVCRKCNMVFYDIQKYLEHKVKHDNFKVKYCKSDIDKRMIMPKLIQRQTRVKREQPLSEQSSGSEQNSLMDQPVGQEEEKENDVHKKKGRRGRRRQEEVHTQDLVITERPVYVCTKCDRKFNREASLKRHMEYDHKEDSDEENDDDSDDGDEVIDDDRDQEYLPNPDQAKEEMAEDEREELEMQEEAPSEVMDTLDQVIMAAELVEQAEAQSRAEGLSEVQSIGPVHVLVQDGTAQDNFADSSNTGAAGEQMVVIAKNSSQSVAPVKLAPRVIQITAAKRGPKTGRKFLCSMCNNKFKDFAVLKAHMLTHSNKRQFKCTFEGCTYAFKTKGSLKRHSRRHTGERPYPCELCGRSFAESGALTRHLKSRTPCTSKSDDDLPRYKKKWAPGLNVPAALAGVTEQEEPKEAATVPPVSVEKILQQGSVISAQPLDQATAVEDEHLAEVLQGALESSQFVGDPSEGVEVIISDGVEAFTADENVQQFVHTEIVSQSASVVCKVCNEECLSVDALKIHLRTHLAEKLCKCQQCHYVTENKEDFQHHMVLYHGVQIKSNDLLTIAPIGGEEQAEPGQNETHLIGNAQVALGQLLELPEEEVKEPSAVVTNSLMFKCPVCAKPFRSSSYLKLHMRNHTGLRAHKCPKCSRSFITRDTLKKHIATHVEDRNFKCGECNKLFKRLSHVREHIKIHSGLRPFPCSLCEKSFKTNNAMKVHLRTHSDILPYQCNFCHRQFREKGSLVRHTRSHTGERPYECRHCGKCFAEHGTLNRHLKAKVSCKKPVVVRKEDVEDEDTDYTVLAEFSSVVANTQQYIVPSAGEDEQEHNYITAEDGTMKPAKIMVLQASDSQGEGQNDSLEVQSVEVMDAGESVQVTDDYIVITDNEQGVMRVLDSKTGETVALVPMTNMENSEVQTITMSTDGEVSAVAMATARTGQEVEMVTAEPLIESGEVLAPVVEAVGEDITSTIETVSGVRDEDGTGHSRGITVQVIQAVPRELMQTEDSQD